MPSKSSSAKKRKMEEMESDSSSTESEVEEEHTESEEDVEMEQVETKSSSDESEEEAERESDEGEGEEEQEEKTEEAQISESEDESSSESGEKEVEEVAVSSESEEEQVEENGSESEEEEREEVADVSESEAEEEEQKNGSESEEKPEEEVADVSQSEEEEEQESEKEQESSLDSDKEEEADEKEGTTQRQPVKVTLPTEKKRPVKVQQPTEKQPPVKVQQPTEKKKPTTVEPPKKKQKVEKKELTEEEIKLKLVHRVLEPFAKEGLTEILSNASMKYQLLYNYIKGVVGTNVTYSQVVVRELAPQTTTNGLKEKYSVFGRIEHAAVKGNEGHGIVKFCDIEAAVRAVESSTLYKIDGCYPTCHFKEMPNNFDATRQAQRKSAEGASRKIFVGGISKKTTSKTLRQEFKRFGEVENAYVPCNPQTKEGKGFGFVTFREEAATKSALEVPEKAIDGCQVVCKRFVGSSKPDFPVQSDGVHGPPQRHPDSHQVFVKHLSKGTTNKMLRREFAKFGEVVSVNIPSDGNTGESKSFGFVTYGDKAGAKKALRRASEIRINGRKILCELKTAGNHKQESSAKKKGNNAKRKVSSAKNKANSIEIRKRKAKKKAEKDSSSKMNGGGEKGSNTPE